MKKMQNKIKTWWRRQDATAAKEALAKEAGERGKQLFYLSIGGYAFPSKLFEAMLSKVLDIDVAGVFSVGQGTVATVMLATSMALLAVSFALSLKPKDQAKAKKKS